MLRENILNTKTKTDMKTTMGKPQKKWTIEKEEKHIQINAGIITLQMNFSDKNLLSKNITINETQISTLHHKHLKNYSGLSFTLSKAIPNERPKGLKLDESQTISQSNQDIGNTDGLKIDKKNKELKKQDVKWENLVSLTEKDWNNHIKNAEISLKVKGEKTKENREKKTVERRYILGGTQIPELEGFMIKIYSEIYQDWPVIRRWVEFENTGKIWLKVKNLVFDAIKLKNEFSHKTLLTPSERGACASIMAFSDEDKEIGIILGSEVPSAIRSIEKHLKVGYNPNNFEWVLGPQEDFTTEKFFFYGFQGESHPTPSAHSYALDRVVERDFKTFLDEVIGVRAVPEKLPVPLWCTWSNFHAMINDSIIREQAKIAAECGFVGFQIDAGWSDSEDDADWTCGSRVPHKKKFPNFEETCRFVREQGLQLGLWLSCYRNDHSPDIKDMPEAISIPKKTRGEGIAMSFASDWKKYFAKDVLHLHEKYGAIYFKQDLTNMKFGDIAEGHESRTKKESLLRAIRGFFKSQDIIHNEAPDVVTLLSHEIYWGTPGVPCDIAATQHCWTFHIPPNDYSGCGNRRQPVRDQHIGKLYPNKYFLYRGCKHSRDRYYKHRGLPLYCIEYYGAATVNIKDSLTPKIQDRQICSWLMGAPTVYAGDLSSLTDQQKAHYRKRFKIIKRLQEQYRIYRYFQYSGVPQPTDLKWHWWGKLNDDGYGAVVVMRGIFGGKRKTINIPWVKRDKTYKVQGLLKEKEYGTLNGEDLVETGIQLKLGRLDQEILELSPIENRGEKG